MTKVEPIPGREDKYEYWYSKKFGRTVVPKDMERRISKDADYHICVVTWDVGERVLCLFVPMTANLSTRQARKAGG